MQLSHVATHKTHTTCQTGNEINSVRSEHHPKGECVSFELFSQLERRLPFRHALHRAAPEEECY
jgi:hypothetical protein